MSDTLLAAVDMLGNVVTAEQAEPLMTMAPPSKGPWSIYALRLGKDVFTSGGKLVFEGSFKDAHDFLDFFERIPMNTPGMEAIQQIQNPQPYTVRLIGPLVTLKLTNKKTCLNIEING